MNPIPLFDLFLLKSNLEIPSWENCAKKQRVLFQHNRRYSFHVYSVEIFLFLQFSIPTKIPFYYRGVLPMQLLQL